MFEDYTPGYLTLPGPVVRLLLAWCLGASLSSCVTYQPAPIDAAETIQQQAGAVIDSQQVNAEIQRLAPGAEWDGHTWNRLSLLAVALIDNPDVALARATAAAVEAEARAAEVAPGPSFALATEYAFNAPEASPWLLGVAGDLPIDAGDRREARIDMARLQARMSFFDYLDTAWSVRSRIRRALADRLLTEDEIALAQELVALRESQVTAMSHRVQGGSASHVDLERMRADGASDRLRLTLAEARAASAMLQLTAAVGVPPGLIEASALSWPAVRDPQPMSEAMFSACREAAVVARPAVMRASLAYDQSEAALKSAVASQYPSFRIGAGYVWERGLKKLPFALGLTLPPLDLNHAAIAAAEARRQEAGKALEAAVAVATSTLDLALSDYRSAWTELDRTREQAVIADQIAAQADRAFDAGAINRIDWISAQSGSKAAKLDVLGAVQKVRIAEAALEDSLRQPLDGPEREIGGNQILNEDSSCVLFPSSQP
jgi:outer membrane protein TolC